MEDENELELSLGLFCGGSAAKSKSRNGSSSDIRAEENDRGSKIVDDFKNFLHGSNQKQDIGIESSRANSVQSKNFLGDLSKTNVEGDASMNSKGKGMWIVNSSNVVEIEEDKKAEAGYKRKSLFEDMNNAKKHERESHHNDLHEKNRSSHLSITEDCSVAENEDVAESEVDYTTSRLISQHDDMAKRYKGGVGLSESKEITGFTESNAMDLNLQKKFNGSSDSEFKLRNLAYSHPFSVQNVNMQHRPITAGHSLPGMMQVLHSAKLPGAQPVNLGNMPMIFGHHPPAQLLTMDKDSSQGLVSHPQQFHHSFAGKATMQANPHGLSEDAPYDASRRPSSDHAKSDGKQPALDELSSQAEENNVKGSSTNLKAKDCPEKSTPESFFVDFSSIKAGLAADIKFGGCGSYPNLPWVSTTGSRGKTISGVTYRFNPTQIKIVCACHGSHMSPEEFVQHSNEEIISLDNGDGSDKCPNNPAASAQS